MKDFVLITFVKNFFSFGINSIYANLIDSGYNGDIIHMIPENINKVKDPFNQFQLNKLLEHCKGVKIIGISIIEYQDIYKAIQIDTYLKTLNILVIWGGVLIINDPQFFLKYSDLVCVCEGEYVMGQLIERLSANRDFNDIRGIGYKNKDSTIINELPPPIDVNKLPRKVIEINKRYYLFHNRLSSLAVEKKILDQLVSTIGYRIYSIRGCPYKCSYCINSKLYTKNVGFSKLRKLKPQLVINELSEAKESIESIVSIGFSEDDFFSRSSSELEELLKLYKEKIDLPISFNASIKSITNEKILLLKRYDISIKFIKTGLQTASCRINTEVFNRKFSKDEFIKNILLLMSNDWPLCIDVISSNPYEGVKDKISNIAFYQTLSKEIIKLKLNRKLYLKQKLEILEHTLIFFPGTVLYEKALKDKVISEDYINTVLPFRSTHKKIIDINIDSLIISLFRLSLKYPVLNFMMLLLRNRFTFILFKLLVSTPIIACIKLKTRFFNVDNRILDTARNIKMIK